MSCPLIKLTKCLIFFSCHSKHALKFVLLFHHRGSISFSLFYYITMVRVSKKYKNGEYDGEVEDDKRNGLGVFKYTNGGTLSLTLTLSLFYSLSIILLSL